VLLVPLSSGTLGAETAGLLGTLLLATLWQAVLGRVALHPSERHPVFVHIDEAQAVLKLPVDLADMLAQARGMGVSFTLAHQHLGQIEDRMVRSALLGTVRSQIVFQACVRMRRRWHQAMPRG
jgi:type IV secretory pathway TraG/TraD family ATPase VirD4